METNDKEVLLLKAVKTQRSILQLLDHSLLEVYKSEKELPEEEQNNELVELAYRIRNIVARKPELKEIYRQLEEEHQVDLSK